MIIRNKSNRLEVDGPPKKGRWSMTNALNQKRFGIYLLPATRFPTTRKRMSTTPKSTK